MIAADHMSGFFAGENRRGKGVGGEAQVAGQLDVAEEEGDDAAAVELDALRAGHERRPSRFQLCGFIPDLRKLEKIDFASAGANGCFSMDTKCSASSARVAPPPAR